MKLLQNLGGTAARLLTVPPLSGGKLFGIHLVRALEDRYGFLISPKLADEFDLQKGIVFQRGYLGGSSTISRVEFYSNGVRAESEEGAAVADRFIDDVIAWLALEAGVSLGNQGLRIYSSSLELEMSVSLSSKIQLFSNVGTLVGELVEKYGGPNSAFEATGVVMWTSLQNQGPAQFKLERRVDRPFSENIFFSSAPLNTPDHLLALSEIEKAFA